ncbi:MAG: flagellar filament capping protein FliD [Spirochaetia bacterium]|jgi:flagellar hook-associated protein 2|nr:flagellar filament capping protein FliD [Spirochaetia bacterium]
MPVTMGGVASGMDTNGIIDKLVEAEMQPIKLIQRDIEYNRGRIAALEVLTASLKDLEKASRELYGFRASYEDKNVMSSAPHVLTVSSTKLAEKGLHAVEVLDMASSHIISTDEISDDTAITNGRFSIRIADDSYNINFKGGNLKSLQEMIDSAAGERVSSSIMKTTNGKSVLTLTSKIQGRKGEILLSGNFDMLKSIGLAGGMKTQETLGADISFERRYLLPYSGKLDADQYGGVQTEDNGRKIAVTGLLWQEYTLPVKIAVKNDTVFEFSFAYKEEEKPEEEKQDPSRIEIGPDEKTNVAGIELKGYNIARVRPGEQRDGTEKSFDSLMGVGVISDVSGRRVEKIYPVEPDAEPKQKINIGKDFAGKQITKIILYCNDGVAEFSDARISASDETGSSFEPRNVIAKASDAQLRVDGVEISRDKNENLTDVIKGLTLNIKSASQTPVTLKIDQELGSSIDKIKAFVEAYNKYIDIHLELTKIEPSKPGEYAKNKSKNGLFVGDMTIARLENTLSSIISSTYPNRADKPVRVISEIGVSTGKANSGWGAIKQGKLVIDEEILTAVISDNPEGVRMFFGSDSDGDSKEDSGMAFTMVKQLDAYVGTGKNIISTKISLENDGIKTSNDKIARKEDQIKQYEIKLRTKFSAMEKAVSGANAQKAWMNQQMGGGAKQQ